MEELSAHILHGYGDSSRPGQCSPALKLATPQAKLDKRAEVVVIPDYHLLKESLKRLSRYTDLSRNNAKPISYVEVFANECLGLDQGTAHRRRHLCHNLFRTLEMVSWPLDPSDTVQHKENLCLRKLE